ncbi:hypothetical protein [Litoreibacter roseus]|uniref:Uncharacterized protein n=1 Tax=Litoreibacter roseus TaxID=2601869 RepID=A0A6N6JGQ5_9RHOB|nr:hypothetical protein [Litoreibacter roseus]GFE64402.1 hypothetical protein KIN_14760 [Litoreibacter roseus]
MKRFAAVALSTIASIGAVQAAPVTIKSGEHANFSRIVLYLRATDPWTVNTNGREVRIDPGRGVDGFDISNVFTFIPKTRITGAKVDDGDLVLDLACDCDVESEMLTTGHLILDVRDGKPKQAKTPETPITRQAAADARSVLDKPRIQQESPAIQPTQISPTKAETLENFRKGLLENLSVAASRQLLDVKEPLESLIPDTPEISSPTLPPKTEPVTAPTIKKKRLRVTNAIERAVERISELTQSREIACYDTDDYDIAAWTEGNGLSVELASFRRTVMGEFDRVDETAVVQLARTYLYYGMTLEAMGTARAFGLSSPKIDAIRALSSIQQSDELAATHPLMQMQDCAGPVGLWSLLVSDNSTLTVDQTQNAVGEFVRLPTHLRVLIGPALISALKEANEILTAEIIQNTVDRARSLKDPLESNDPKVNALAMVAANDPSSPDALIDYLDDALAAGTPVEIRFIDLAASFVHELHGTPTADTLRNLQIRALSQNSDFSAAYAIFSKDTAAFQNDLIAASLAQDVVASAESEDLVRTALQFDQASILPRLDDEIKIRWAERLLTRGLPDTATLVLATTSDSDASKLLRAKALKIQKQREDALRAVEGLAIAEARRLRANVQIQLGRTQEAWLENAPDVDTAEERAELAWRTAQWGQVLGEDIRADIAGRIISTARTDTDGEAPLKQARNMIDTSREDRAALQELLAPDGS